MNFIKKIIDQWDPIGLLLCSPNDEYDSEIEKIYKVWQETNDTEILGIKIYYVFKKSFGDVFDRSRSECKEIAHKILDGESMKNDLLS
jgi:hypothetical protein